MRTHARKFRAGIAAALVLVTAPSTASAAASPPTISSRFTPVSIGSGGTTALSFTITNPNASPLSGVGFTDTLPSGVIVDNPNGQNGTCGPSSTLTAAAGSSTISLSGGNLAASGVSTASCTVQVSVTSTAPGSYQNSTGPVISSEATPGNSDTETLTVFGPPTVSVTGPKENAVYAFKQKVIARYRCADAVGAPGIFTCSGDTDSGRPINTSTAGGHTFSVSAVSADGTITTQIIHYGVRPDNRFTVPTVRAHADGSVTFKVKVPNPGRLVSTVVRNNKTFGQTTKVITSRGTISITVKPNAGARKLIKADAKAKHPKAIAVKLSVSFTPVFGVTRTVSGGSLKFTP